MTPGFVKTGYQKKSEKLEGWIKEAEAAIHDFDSIMSSLKEQEKRWRYLNENGFVGSPAYNMDHLGDQIKRKEFSRARTGIEELSRMTDESFGLLSRRDSNRTRLNDLLKSVGNDPELSAHMDQGQVEVVREYLRMMQLEKAEKGIAELSAGITKARSDLLEKRQLSSRLEALKKRWRSISEEEEVEYPILVENHILVLLDSGNIRGSKEKLDLFERELISEEERLERIKRMEKRYSQLNHLRDHMIRLGLINDNYAYRGEVDEAVKNRRFESAESLIEENGHILGEIRRLGDDLKELAERWNEEIAARGKTEKYRDESLIVECLLKGDVKYAGELLGRFEKRVLKLEEETAMSTTPAVKEVFISYATADKNVAFAVCHSLEEKKIRCWIAPRDVLPGENYAKAIIRAINTSQIMVLIFSSNSNGSHQVLREVERAVSKGIVIIPLRIEEVLPSDEFEYFISSSHWLDAITKPFEDHVNKLTDSVNSILGMIHKNDG